MGAGFDCAPFWGISVFPLPWNQGMPLDQILEAWFWVDHFNTRVLIMTQVGVDLMGPFLGNPQKDAIFL